MDVSSRTFLDHNKLATMETFIFFLGSTMLWDSFLLFRFNQSVFVADYDWYSANLQIYDAITFALFLTCIYGAVSPFILWSIDLLKNSDGEISDLYKSIKDLKNDSILENNTALYNYAESCCLHLEQVQQIRKYAVAVGFALIISIVFSLISDQESLFSVFWGHLSGDGVFSIFIRLVSFGICLYLIGALSVKTSPDENYEYIRHYGLRLREKWIAEFASGLIDKQVFFSHLSSLLKSQSPELGAKVIYNPRDTDHEFCKKHDLVIVDYETNSLTLTSKGQFFKKYLSMHEPVIS